MVFIVIIISQIFLRLIFRGQNSEYKHKISELDWKNHSLFSFAIDSYLDSFSTLLDVSSISKKAGRYILAVPPSWIFEPDLTHYVTIFFEAPITRYYLNSVIIALYSSFNIPFVVWMMRGFFIELPREFEEAAMTDGCSRVSALIRIVLPLTAPILAVSAVFCLIFSWNDFSWVVMLTSSNAKTMPVEISTYNTGWRTDWGAMGAAGMVAMIPIVIGSLIINKYII